MSHADRAAELRRQADLVEHQGELAARLDAAADAYRANPTDETRAEYNAASNQLRANRAAERADRPGMAVIAEIAED